MDIEGRVVWLRQASKSSPAGMGIEFINIAPEHKEKIGAFVAANLSQIREQAIF